MKDTGRIPVRLFLPLCSPLFFSRICKYFQRFLVQMLCQNWRFDFPQKRGAASTEGEPAETIYVHGVCKKDGVYHAKIIK